MSAQSFPPGRPVLDAAVELIGRIKADIAYEIGATTVTTTPPMSFALRRGVCQDFAHIMISGLRGIGLPAAYVSGYLRSVPRTDRDAAARRRRHACLGDAVVRRREPAGSGSIRPMRCSAGEDHVMLAIGRDYTDVAPMDGVILGSGGQRIDVAVGVTPAADRGGDRQAPVAAFASAASAAARRPVTSVTPGSPWRCAIQPGSL